MLRQYQSYAISAISKELKKTRRVLFQQATGSGKTVLFCEITKRFIEKSGSPVLILVHRKELISQTVAHLKRIEINNVQTILAGMKVVPESLVYVGMIESTVKRMPKNVSLVIIDEAHNMRFSKVFKYFTDQYIIGITATPISTNKKASLKKYYNSILCGTDIFELIEGGFLCKNLTYIPDNCVDTSTLRIDNGEYAIDEMANEFSKVKHIENVVSAYKKYGAGKKCLVFNSNIAHSKLVNEAFISAGFNSHEINSDSKNRDEIIGLYLSQSNIILNNVSILTTGFDAPDIEIIIVNRATLSLSLWLQCCGRGSRPAPGKKEFIIIDLGNNANTQGDWTENRDWARLFNGTSKKSKTNGALAKRCPQCHIVISRNLKDCPKCGHVFESDEDKQQTERLYQFVLFSKSIQVEPLILQNKYRKDYYTFFLIGKKLATSAKKSMPVITESDINIISEKYFGLAKIWCRLKQKKFNAWHKKIALENLLYHLKS